MQQNYQPLLQDIPLEQIDPKIDQPRKELNINEDDRLLISLKEEGLGAAITVSKIGDNSYRIINGHRRYACAQTLGWKTIRCEVYPKMDEAGLKRLRFNIQNNSRPWKPLERSKEIVDIKKEKQFKSNKELAAYLHYPESLLSSSLGLNKKLERYEKLIGKYEISDSYQAEFVKLYPKIRDIREISVDEIVDTLFYRVKHQIIKSAKDFRKLSSVFLRAQANEQAIYDFLKNTDMKVDDLYLSTERSGYLRDLETLTRQTAEKLKEGRELKDDEKKALKEFFELLKRGYAFE